MSAGDFMRGALQTAAKYHTKSKKAHAVRVQAQQAADTEELKRRKEYFKSAKATVPKNSPDWHSFKFIILIIYLFLF